MIPHQLPTCEQLLEFQSRFLCWGASVERCSNKTVRSCLWIASPVFVCSGAVTLTLHYLLPAHGHRGGLSSPSFVHAARPPVPTKTLHRSVVTSINETLPVTISTLPHLTSPGLTSRALQIKEGVYEPALVWQRWWGVITVERLSCSLHTWAIELIRPGTWHEEKGTELLSYCCSIMVLL